MSYIWRPAWYERLEKWVDRDGDLDAGYQLFGQFGPGFNNNKSSNLSDKGTCLGPGQVQA